EPGGTEAAARTSVKTLDGVPAGGLTRTAGDVRPADREAGRGGAACRRRASAGSVADDATGSGSEHGAGVRADPRRCNSVSARQTGGELSGADSARGKFGRTAEAGRDLETRQPAAAFVAGGSGTDCGALRSRISPTVFASLSSEAESCGEGGSGAQVSGTTLLDATHTETVSRDRSHREQPAGAPGRRK